MPKHKVPLCVDGTTHHIEWIEGGVGVCVRRGRTKNYQELWDKAHRDYYVKRVPMASRDLLKEVTV